MKMARKRPTKSKTPLIKKHGEMMLALSKAPPQFRKKLIKEAPKDLINCVGECCKKFLKGNVSLSEAHKRQLHSKRQQLRVLANKTFPIQKKKRILNQKGGFLPLLAVALRPVINRQLAKLIDKI
jgi:hypothetical protein